MQLAEVPKKNVQEEPSYLTLLPWALEIPEASY